MSLDERSAKAAKRCERHPAASVIAECADCGRPMCVRCAVPVRGRVLGEECLPAALGPNLVLEPEHPTRARLPLPWTGIAFAVAALASIIPWKRFGPGSGLLGAWAITPRWSMLAGIGALVGLMIWGAVALRPLSPRPRWVAALRVLAGLVIAGSVLHLLRPPSFGPSSIGPWLALAAGIVALVTTLRWSRSPARAGS
ncbi:MAG: hypothetical protein WD004_01050 [Actinomycetota bacterium]